MNPQPALMRTTIPPDDLAESDEAGSVSVAPSLNARARKNTRPPVG
jgi:hypothetical protein